MVPETLSTRPGLQSQLDVADDTPDGGYVHVTVSIRLVDGVGGTVTTAKAQVQFWVRYFLLVLFSSGW